MPSPSITFELCAETLGACLAARDGGAHRIELCSALVEGGLTPSHGLIRQAIQQSGLPVHVLLRPRPGNFVYSPADFAVMLDDLQHLRTHGAHGVVLGILNPDSTIDLPRLQQLLAAAGPLEVTFHRAFDETPDLPAALETLIATGCARVLTAGGAPDATQGAATLRQLVNQAQGRIQVALGGGLRPANAAALAHATGATHFHAALGPPTPANPWRQNTHDPTPEDVAALLRQLP